MASDIKLFNMDCMEALREMEDNQFDLAIVDPPYGIELDYFNRPNKQYKGSKGKNKDYHLPDILNNALPDGGYFAELMRCSKRQVIWGGNYFINHLHPTSCFIIWDKDNTGNWADCEQAWTSFQSPAKIFKFRWNGMLQQDMKNKENRIHPTQKPVALYKWLLTNYAEKGQTILDTHLGSGSIALACWDLGFDLCGYELDEDYFASAFQRLEEHKKQGQFEFA